MKTSLLLLFVCFFLIHTIQAQIPSSKLDKMSTKELDSLINIGFSQGKFNDVILYSDIALKKVEAEFGKVDTIYADFLASKGYAYLSLGDLKTAEVLLPEATELMKKAAGAESALYGKMLSYLAFLYDDLAKYDVAEPIYLQIIEIDKKTIGNKHPAHASSLTNLAALYIKTGKYEKAEGLFLESLDIKAETVGKQSYKYANSLGFLGNLYTRMGRYDEAEEIYILSRNTFQADLGEENPYYAASLINLATLYETVGRYEEAEPLYLEGLDIELKLYGEQNPKYARSLHNIASMYKEMGKLDVAEKYYLKAQEISQKVFGENHFYFASSLNNLGLLYEKMDKLDNVEALYLKALKLVEKIFDKNHSHYASTLNNLGLFYTKVARYAEAEKSYSSSLQIDLVTKGAKHPYFSSTLNNFSNLYLKMNRLDTAFTYCLSGIVAISENFGTVFPELAAVVEDSVWRLLPLDICQKLNAEDLSKLTQLKVHSSMYFLASLKKLQEIAQTQYETNPTAENLKKYYAISKAAIQINEQTLNEFSGDKSKLRLLKENHIFVRQGIESAILLDKDVFIKEAFGFAEQNKSILLTNAIKGNRARTLGDLPDSLILKEIELQQKKDDLQRKKSEAKSPNEKRELFVQENALNNEIDVFLKSLKDKFPRYHALKYQNISAKAEGIQSLIDEKTLFIEYFLSESIIYVFAISATKTEVFQCSVSTEELKKQIKALRHALSSYKFITTEKDNAYQAFTSSAHWFYNQILKPALQDKKVENLIIVTDGELGHLPFEVFLVKAAPQNPNTNYSELAYLTKDYNISYNYSATLFAATKQNLTLPKTGSGMLACAASYPSMDSTLLTLRQPHIFNLRNALKPLPAVRKEIASLEKAFAGTFVQGDSCNEAFFKKNASQYKVIHLAMHGILHPHDYILSSLAFTENKDSLEDNFLQAYEISKMNLNAELVVLSACETGYGNFEQGEGVMSLARSFMYAGVPSLVVSLWQVNDYSTAVLMQTFYQNLSNGMPKDVALRQAKLDYLNNAKGILAHPAFWSPFIQLGDSRPIGVETQCIVSNTVWGAIIGGILLLSVGIFAFQRKRKKE